MMVAKYLAKYSIQKKLFLIIGIGVSGFILYFLGNFVIARHNQQLLQSLVDQHLPMLEASENLTHALASVKSSIAQSALSGNPEGMVYLDAGSKSVIENLNKILALNPNSTELEKFSARYTTAYRNAQEALQTVVVGLADISAVKTDLQKQSEEIARLEQWALKLKSERAKEFRATVDAVNAGGRLGTMTGFVLMIGIIPFVLFFYFITRKVTHGLEQASQRLSEVSQQMVGMSSEAWGSSAKLAAAASQQTASVVESVASLTQMQSKIGQTVRLSSEAMQFSDEGYRQANEGNQAIDKMRLAMEDIKESCEKLDQVNQVVNTIGAKAAIINEIVFKTQILSFNASIEAARAGQHGRGFTVVAAEVGKLAEMSGTAAKEIGVLLDSSTAEVDEIVKMTRQKVDSATDLSRNCAAVFDRITQSGSKIKMAVNSITDAAAEQKTGIHFVGQAVTEVHDSAAESDLLAKSMSQLSQSMRVHSQELASTVNDLEILVHGVRPKASTITDLNPPADLRKAEPPIKRRAV